MIFVVAAAVALGSTPNEPERMRVLSAERADVVAVGEEVPWFRVASTAPDTAFGFRVLWLPVVR
ncbi:MAG: hypothetical protein AAGA48_26410 [Myxococcota bacterium]